MTEIELAKALRKSNYTCEGVDCEECKKTNSIHQCLMRDVQVYCDDILGADDNYIEKLEKENAELKAKLQEMQIIAMQKIADKELKICNIEEENKKLKEQNKTFAKIGSYQMTERQQRAYKFYQDWQKSGLTQKEFLKNYPKIDEYGYSVVSNLAKGVKIASRLEFQRQMERKIDEKRKQDEFNQNHFAYNPIFEKIEFLLQKQCDLLNKILFCMNNGGVLDEK